MRRLGVDTTAEVDPTDDSFDCDHRARALQAAGVVRAVTNCDPVLLGWVKVITEDIGSFFLADLAAEFETSDRVRVGHQLLIRQRAFPVVLPPFGLGLPSVPVEAMSKHVTG